MRRLGGKALSSALSALGATLLVTLFLNLVPGDPIEILLGEQAQQVDRDEMRRAMWLDRSVPMQAWLFLSSLTRGDLRTSLPPFQTRVMPRIAKAAPRTALLAGLAMLLASLVSLPLGIVAALRAGKPIDRVAMALSVLGISFPSFLVAHVLILVFGIRLGWLPISGDEQWLSVLLPAVTLALGLSALLSRVTRVSMLEVLGEDYVLAARARGLPMRSVVLRHALRNALLPILTVAGLQLGAVLTGAIVVEKVFNWPGLGTLLLSGIERRDYNTVRACVLVFTLTYLAVNLATDLAYTLADPRARRGAAGPGPGEAEVILDPIALAPPDLPKEGIFPVTRRWHWTGLLGAGVVLLVVAAALFAPWLSPYGPRQLDLPGAFAAPSLRHLLGAGDNGVDLLTQILYGARVSLAVGVLAVLVAGTLGTVLGTAVGYVGGLADELAMRVVDVLLAFPGLLLAIFLTSVFGPSFLGLIFALSATGWGAYARLARAQTLSLRRRDFVTAARAAGAGGPRIVLRHLLPNLLGPIVVQATFGLPGTILAEAALSFLGLGTRPGTPEWGALVDQGAAHLLDAPHVALVPSAAIALTVLGLNFLGEAVRDRLDPKGS